MMVAVPTDGFDNPVMEKHLFNKKSILNNITIDTEKPKISLLGKHIFQ
jgi:hypothetical protein